MKSLIVDDHKINYVLIKNLLNENFPEFEVADAAGSVSQALKLLESNNYDLIFLDMQLGDGEGFDVLREMTEFVFVIVITSHPDYALEAFRYNVTDYLVKPVKPEEFRSAVNKVLGLHKKFDQNRSQQAEDLRTAVENRKILVNHRNDYVVVNKESILYIRAQGKYSEIHTDKGQVYLSSKNLKEFEDDVTGGLVRVHNSYLVNINAMLSYSKEDSTLALSSGAIIPVSVRKRDTLFKLFRIY